MKLRLAHLSMQFSDSPREQESDVEKLFTRAATKGYAWITGTEAGQSGLNNLLEEGASEHDYRYWRPPHTDCWIAVSKEVVDGDWDPYYREIIPAESDHGPRGVVAVGFNNHRLGSVEVIAAHYLTRGRPGDIGPRLEYNKDLARAIGRHAHRHGKGWGLVFYGGDQNIVDSVHDTFFGEPLTSSWDELEKWRATGHGNIDVIASYDPDKRVEAISARALPDSQIHFHSDHYLVESTFEVQPLNQEIIRP